jgi:hypothetical protein
VSKYRYGCKRFMVKSVFACDMFCAVSQSAVCNYSAVVTKPGFLLPCVRNTYTVCVVRIYEQMYVPIPVAARCKAWVCGRSLAGVAVSNPSGSMDTVSKELCDARWRSLRRADHSSKGVLPSVVCLSVIVKPRY